jgi:hypothetical protein
MMDSNISNSFQNQIIMVRKTRGGYWLRWNKRLLFGVIIGFQGREACIDQICT